MAEQKDDDWPRCEPAFRAVAAADARSSNAAEARQPINVVSAAMFRTPTLSPMAHLVVVGEAPSGGWRAPRLTPVGVDDAETGTYGFALTAVPAGGDGLPVPSAIEVCVPFLWTPRLLRAVIFPGEVVATPLERATQTAGFEAPTMQQLRQRVDRQLRSSIGQIVARSGRSRND